MNHRIRLAAALAAAAVGISIAPPAQASADDRDSRHCVSKREYYLLFVSEDVPRAQVEARLEVTGLGRPVNYYDGATYILRYPACGYASSEGAVRIQYFWKNDIIYAADRPVRKNATLHGHARS